MEAYIWLGIAIISVIVEITTTGLMAIWFAPAALLSMILSLFGAPVSVQIPVFVVVSGLLLLLFYKKIKENIDKKSEKTNLDALIGKEALVEEDIPERETGRVKVGGISWAAHTKSGHAAIKKGEYVRIVAIDGVKLEVEALEAKPQQDKETVCKE